MLLYYITDRTQFPGEEHERQERLLDKIAEAALNGIDFVQLREKELSGRELELLAREARNRVRGSKTRLLINSRTDIALAVGADGVHLRSTDISPQEVRKIWHEANGAHDPVIAVSCHTEAEVIAANESGADFVVFGPMFEKKGPEPARATSTELLRSACRHRIPVVALGGVTVENAPQCAEEGVGGVAGIRLFQEGDLSATVERLRGS